MEAPGNGFLFLLMRYMIGGSRATRKCRTSFERNVSKMALPKIPPQKNNRNYEAYAKVLLTDRRIQHNEFTDLLCGLG